MKIAVIVQGLFERSDSIGYDAIYQFEHLHSKPGYTVRLFCERLNKGVYPDLECGSVDEFKEFCRSEHGVVVLYHFCDGWPTLDQWLIEYPGYVIVRWHNNTPPWFYSPTNPRAAQRTVFGFRSIIQLCEQRDCAVWVNSSFSKHQLIALLSGPCRISVVYPASRFLTERIPARRAYGNPSELHVLFVGRVVAHKGYLHLIETCSRVQRLSKRQVTLHIVGRRDGSAVQFNASLDRAISEAECAISVHGEISNDDLHGLYASASIFLCLSEHEGFGMPVFEAMRYGIPVVAWACTALEELLEGHPFAFSEFDIAKFAAAVLLASRTEYRKPIQKIQLEILKKYTASGVAAQIDHAIGALRGAVSAEVQFEKISLILGIEAARDFERAAQKARRSNTYLLKDSGRNLVSLYDLEIYEHYAKAAASQSFNAAQVPSSKSPVHKQTEIVFKPSDFSRGEGTSIGKNEIRIDHAPVNGYSVFGPYVPAPAGRYEALFEFEGINESGRRIAVAVDVNSESSGVLSSRALWYEIGESFRPIALTFAITSESDVCEFRVRISAGQNVGLQLMRVCVRKQAGLSDLIFSKDDALNLLSALSNSQSSKVIGIAGSVLNAAKKMIQIKNLIKSRTAVEAFRKGDDARDRKEWNTAIVAYEAGLSLQPDSFAYRVQCGHAYKEIGQLEKAMACYRVALAQQPMDSDLHLQIGHLYKQLGGIREAEIAYARAMYLGRAGIDAALELKGLGLNEKVIETLMSRARSEAANFESHGGRAK